MKSYIKDNLETNLIKLFKIYDKHSIKMKTKQKEIARVNGSDYNLFDNKDYDIMVSEYWDIISIGRAIADAILDNSHGVMRFDYVKGDINIDAFEELYNSIHWDGAKEMVRSLNYYGECSSYEIVRLYYIKWKINELFNMDCLIEPMNE